MSKEKKYGFSGIVTKNHGSKLGQKSYCYGHYPLAAINDDTASATIGPDESGAYYTGPVNRLVETDESVITFPWNEKIIHGPQFWDEDLKEFATKPEQTIKELMNNPYSAHQANLIFYIAKAIAMLMEKVEELGEK